MAGPTTMSAAFTKLAACGAPQTDESSARIRAGIVADYGASGSSMNDALKAARVDDPNHKIASCLAGDEKKPGFFDRVADLAKGVMEKADAYHAKEAAGTAVVGAVNAVTAGTVDKIKDRQRQIDAAVASASGP